MTDTLSISATNDYLGGDDLSATMYVAYRPSGVDSIRPRLHQGADE